MERYLFFILLLCSLAGSHSHSYSSHSSFRGSVGQATQTKPLPSLRCRLVYIDTEYESGFNPLNDLAKKTTAAEISSSEYGCAPIVDGEETSDLFYVTPPKSLIQKYPQESGSSQLVVDIKGSINVDGNTLLTSNASFYVKSSGLQSRSNRVLRPLPTTIGTKTLFIVRISTPDSTHPKTLSEFQRIIFGTNVTSFKSQYEACSFDKLRWVNAGGADVMLDLPISNYAKPAQLVDAADEKLQTVYEMKARNLADHVVYCSPPGTTGWLAVAGVAHWRVHLSHSSCLSLSTLMHEIGHNLGLMHSRELVSEYGDETGFMGAGEPDETGPKKCFNAYHNDQLGWYSDRYLRIDDLSTPQQVKLATFVDYDKADTTEPVLINIGDEYYLQYNRAKGMNLETGEKKDMVTVTEGFNGYSSLESGLVAGQNFVTSNFKGTGFTLVVSVCERLDGGGAKKADLMVLAIGLDKSWC